jgi:hypothetical protein
MSVTVLRWPRTRGTLEQQRRYDGHFVRDLTEAAVIIRFHTGTDRRGTTFSILIDKNSFNELAREMLRASPEKAKEVLAELLGA